MSSLFRMRLFLFSVWLNKKYIFYSLLIAFEIRHLLHNSALRLARIVRFCCCCFFCFHFFSFLRYWIYTVICLMLLLKMFCFSSRLIFSKNAYYSLYCILVTVVHIFLAVRYISTVSRKSSLNKCIIGLTVVIVVNLFVFCII
jgi:hypothetical protein